jgi:predicted acyltransferase
MRGLTIAGMIVVNNAGGSVSYDYLRHSAWNGLTPCDLVFPFFLFIMGVTTYISLAKNGFHATGSVVRKVVRRALLIILIGWAIHWVELALKGEPWAFAQLRLTGVLPRIGLCFGIVSLMALTMSRRAMAITAALLLVGYTLLVCLYNGYAEDVTNFNSIVDRFLVGETHLYHKSPVDPEGLAGTITALAHTIIGFLCGSLLKAPKANTHSTTSIASATPANLSNKTNWTNKPNLPDCGLAERILALFVAGFLLMSVGYLLTEWLPLNKRIWSPTFVLVTTGLAALLLATLTTVIDLWQHRLAAPAPVSAPTTGPANLANWSNKTNWTNKPNNAEGESAQISDAPAKPWWVKFFEMFGVNPLFLYVVSELLAIIIGHLGWKPAIYAAIQCAIPEPYLASAIYAVAFMLLHALLAYPLYTRRIYIKI